MDEPSADRTTTNSSVVLRREAPTVLLSSNSQFPRSGFDKLKLRRRINVFPLRITLKADWAVATRDFTYGCSVKDSLLGGRFTVNVGERQVGYRKNFSLPNGSKLQLVGSASYQEDGSVKPDFGVQYKFGGDMITRAGHTDAMMIGGNAVGIRQKINVIKGLGVEVNGAVRVPQPTATYTYDGGSLSIGEGAFELHVQEVNGILRIGY
jgi:hypothetical protein